MESSGSHVVFDGRLFATGQLAATSTGVEGDAIDARQSGKHRDFGATI